MLFYLAEYGLFLAKSITVVVALVMAVSGIASVIFRNKHPKKARLEIVHLNKGYEEMERHLSSVLINDAALRMLDKQDRKKAKSDAKSDKKNAKGASSEKLEEQSGKRIFVLDFDGDIRASGVKAMREEITAVLTVATSNDEVLLRMESGGGLVYSYGLASSQLQRIRDAGISLTIAVDKVAASGGYMMACVANTIIAAPFSMVGSIGVIAQVPNFHRLLKKHDVDYEQVYAGEYKRTLTMFGENTDKGREKMQNDLEDTHELFKDFIKSARPTLDVERVATGETWFGTKALELGLVDKLQTSDDFLMQARKDADLIKLSYVEKKNVMGSLSALATAGLAFRDKFSREKDDQLLM
ncbi:MAG: protease SohB [Kofleriaceae bacterium]|nr:protease SohB [Kofleriaceae bacterium]